MHPKGPLTRVTLGRAAPGRGERETEPGAVKGGYYDDPSSATQSAAFVLTDGFNPEKKWTKLDSWGVDL